MEAKHRTALSRSSLVIDNKYIFSVVFFSFSRGIYALVDVCKSARINDTKEKKR
jgi:hypothetical protein